MPFESARAQPCARLVLSGDLSKVAAGADEHKAAMAALVAKHPSFADYPAGHDFYVAKLTLDGSEHRST